MRKKITTWTIWLVLASALLGQTVSASYGVSRMCKSLASDSIQVLDGASMPDHMAASKDMKNCCEESDSGGMGSCEMHSCVVIGLQSSEFNHSVSFNISQTHFDQQYQHILVPLDSVYRPPIFI